MPNSKQCAKSTLMRFCDLDYFYTGTVPHTCDYCQALVVHLEYIPDHDVNGRFMVSQMSGSLSYSARWSYIIEAQSKGCSFHFLMARSVDEKTHIADDEMISGLFNFDERGSAKKCEMIVKYGERELERRVLAYRGHPGESTE